MLQLGVFGNFPKQCCENAKKITKTDSEHYILMKFDARVEKLTIFPFCVILAKI